MEKQFDVFSTDPRTPSVVIIGVGYIGSSLHDFIRHSTRVSLIDISPSIDDLHDVKRFHSNDLSRITIDSFDVVIFLGGCTGRTSCSKLNRSELFEENIQSVLNLAMKMSPEQHFIVASTSAVMEGILDAQEADEINFNLLDVYSQSMANRERTLKEFCNVYSKCPRISFLRFGTVIGSSKGQRTDLLVPGLFTSAYSDGILKIKQGRTKRSFLSLHDLRRAIYTLIHDIHETDSSFHIFHLASFQATILKVATTVSSITGATISIMDDPKENSIGFSLNCNKFVSRYNFTFHDTLLLTLSKFDEGIPQTIIPQGPHKVPELVGHKCPVCGSSHHDLMLDLGNQPLANDFHNDSKVALNSKRYPLKLIRCRSCNHYHLSHVVDRSQLFQNYLYRSGTSATLNEYFFFLAKKITDEVEILTKNATLSVLEIACNDGTQLNHFKALGWKTYGVDPAQNLIEIAKSKGHLVSVGFWPNSKFRRFKYDAIVAQNVLAHVIDIIPFLKGCAEVMTSETKLYIQTSQCNMQQLGQIDTIYHEHVSFFTGHSFERAAELSGLFILSFETTPIHGESCLVTMQLSNRRQNQQSLSLRNRMDKEIRDGIVNDIFPTIFQTRSRIIKEWLKSEIHHFHAKKFSIGAYGAAAKGMVLLHFIFGENSHHQKNHISFVLDDAPLKQNTFCPGTEIPIFSTEQLPLLDTSENLAIVVLAWNFLSEIIHRLQNTLKNKRKIIYLIVPFPSPRTLKLFISSGDTIELRALVFRQTMIPNPLRDERRKKVVLINHQRNEEFLLPFFIIHHSSMFDKAILIDFNSSDQSTNIFDELAPATWTMIQSNTDSIFDAVQLDKQVMDLEIKNPECWHIALTTTEFLIQSNLRIYLMENNESLPSIKKYQIINMIGDDAKVLSNKLQLPVQRNQGAKANSNPYRYLHMGTENTYRYSPGRHNYEAQVQGNHLSQPQLLFASGFIMKFMFTPWPEIIKRKISVGLTIPQKDIDERMGIQHTEVVNNSSALEMQRKTYLENNAKDIFSICDMNYSEHIPMEMWLIHIEYNKNFGHCLEATKM